MADQPAQPDKGNWQIATEGAIPRMGLNIPIPASTKPPPAPGQQSSAKPVGQK
jgi:hypothetical protein